MQFFKNQKYSKDVVCSKVKNIFEIYVNANCELLAASKCSIQKECQQWQSFHAIVAAIKNCDGNTEHEDIFLHFNNWYSNLMAFFRKLLRVAPC